MDFNRALHCTSIVVDLALLASVGWIFYIEEVFYMHKHVTGNEKNTLNPVTPPISRQEPNPALREIGSGRRSAY